MQCPICDASISEVEAASTCPVCGIELAQTVFTSQQRDLDDHGRRPGLSLVSSEGPSDDSEVYLEEVPEPDDVGRHPAAGNKKVSGKNTKGKNRLGPPQFFYFSVYNLGNRAHYWVRSSAKTPARKSLRKWLKGQGVVITDKSGNRIDLLEHRVDRGKAYDAAMPVLGGPIATLPDGVSGYLDAYAELRDDPAWRRL